MKTSRILLAGIVVLTLATPGALFARYDDSQLPSQTEPSPASPAYGVAAHMVGKLGLTVCNNGTFGDGFSPTGCSEGSCLDMFTGQNIPSCEYPIGSRTKYLFAASIWIGAVVGRDTLVSVGADGWQPSGGEFNPDEPPIGNMIYRSTIDPAKPEFNGAISEQDYIAVYYDTCTRCNTEPDVIDGRGHRPLYIEVTQRSFAWSYEYAEDFVLFDYAIRNFGTTRLKKVYMGVYVDADIQQEGQADGAQDDLCGFRRTFPATYLPSYYGLIEDTVNIAWTVDNDGDFDKPSTVPVPNITGTRIVRTPSEELEVSFNWWVSNISSALDYGPQTRNKFRDMQTGGSGTPEGDRNKYFVLSNGEFDFDQVKTASIPFDDTTWFPPPDAFKEQWSTGLDTRYLLSFGPFDIEPGQTLPISLAYVGGENFHQSASNFANLPYNWQAYYEGVSFDDLAKNATWASWIYDNPGVDTDNDGYSGRYYYAVNSEGDTIDSFAATGDGVPDFKGAGPPPAPDVRVQPLVGSIRVLFNGYRSENTPDVFTDTLDFEGYRVYYSRDDRRSSYSVLTSYDIQDYNKYVWFVDTIPEPDTAYFRLTDIPMTLQELRDLYSGGDPNWRPDNYSASYPFFWDLYPDSIFYFTPQDFNRYILKSDDSVNYNSPIARVYPNALKPLREWWSTGDRDFRLPDSIYESGLDTAYLDEDGRWKYYEYEYTIENLLPTVPYWVNVSAFDFGSPSSGLTSLETNPANEPAVTYALPSSDAVAAQGLDVFCYPNPYRLDAGYQASGFEGRGLNATADRSRIIHFANLPAKCRISIFTLDGDLVREIDHPSDIPNPGCEATDSHECWNLITRNAQLVVSGLYYWVVEDEEGNTQIGKLVIIL